jgi:hypothetical protein
VAEEISKYKLDLVEIQEISWAELARNEQSNIYIYEKENENHELGIGFLLRAYENHISSP